jgi:hypothetical protein
MSLPAAVYGSTALTASQPSATKAIPGEPALEKADRELRKLIGKATGSPEYWSFATVRNDYSHCYFRYPAMMVAEMQRHLISIVLQLQPNVRTLGEPFAGSGTVLLEGMFRGLDIYAYDINPLAILLCKSKAVLCYASELNDAANGVIARAKKDRHTRITVQFKGLQKWFSKRAAIELSALRRAIQAVEELPIRRFLWVALAETVRQTSKSRTSTYKLHIRPNEERRRLPLPIGRFAEVVHKNIKLYKRTRQKLVRSKFVRGRRYAGKIRVGMHDARKRFAMRFDLVVTSPPYGDNQSTVPYGQNSFLPLQWIDLKDIDPHISRSWIRTAYEIDNRSLGGQSQRGIVRRTNAEILKVSPSLARTIRAIPTRPVDRRRKILRFALDVNASLNAIAGCVNHNAYLVFTLGNRRVANRNIPLDAIVAELFHQYGVKQVLSIGRRIPSKRMATRNSTASTIRKEQIAIFRKNRP